MKSIITQKCSKIKKKKKTGRRQEQKILKQVKN